MCHLCTPVEGSGGIGVNRPLLLPLLLLAFLFFGALQNALRSLCVRLVADAQRSCSVVPAQAVALEVVLPSLFQRLTHAACKLMN